MGEGAGVVVLEEYEHARARGAKIYAEVLGYGLSGDAYHITAPSEDGDGGYRSMAAALKRAGLTAADIDYINAHGTSTPAGDIRELEAVKAVFGEAIPFISSTKSLSGHSLGAAGVHEAIYTLLMMDSRFIAASANIDQLDPGAEGIPIVRQRIDDARINVAMSNSFGFGGTNASLIFQRYDG
jgi:3-oxoacyl-[acyl-carrier-protein] synthase-1